MESNDTVRAFFAIPIPDDSKLAIQETLTPIKQTCPKGWVHWSPILKWHVTLSFLGEISQELIPQLREGMEKSLQPMPAPTLSSNQIKLFPSKRHAHILALELDRNPALMNLYQQTQQLMLDAHLKPETRTYRPHITLGRMRHRAPQHWQDIKIKPLSFIAEQLILFYTERDAHGTYYRPIQQTTLTN